MKKILAILLSLVLIMSFSGCGVKEKIENKVGEAVGEKAIESLGGGNVDISGDKVTIKGENGAEVTIGSTEWPKSDLGKSIASFKDGKIASVMDSESYVLIIIEEVNEKDFTNYAEDVKKNFTVDSYEMKSNDMTSYGAGDGKGISIQLTYENGNKTLTIAATKIEK